MAHRRVQVEQRLNRSARLARDALWALEGLRDRWRLEARISGLGESWHASSPRIAEEFSAPYEAYLRNISTDRMTISLELATFLSFICALTRPRRVLDLGSGFSSYVFRKYQAEEGGPIEVLSIDHSPHWLEKTRAFLAEQGLSTGQMETLATFKATTPLPFDVLFYDLGAERRKLLSRVISLRHSTGLVVLDDFQIIHYRKYVREYLRGTPHALYSLYWHTRDRFLRFAALISGSVAAGAKLPKNAGAKFPA